MQTIFPILRYKDARGAIRSLCAIFGFIELFSVPESGPIVQHAQLKLGTNVIMLGSVRLEDGITSPQELGTTTAVITHNAAIAGMADRVIRLGSGQIVEARSNRVKARPADLEW